MFRFILSKIILLLVNLGLYNTKRVFICSYVSKNYGTTLLNYALSEKLKELGYDPLTIRWGASFHRTLGGRNDRLLDFWASHVNKTKIVYTQKQLEEIMCRGNKIVFGGDTIFRTWFIKHENNPLQILRYYGDFVSGRKTMVSYAPSFCTRSWDGDEYTANECRKLLKRFDRISIREKSGAELLKKKFDVESTQVVDPVLFYGASFYERLIDKAVDIEEHNNEYIAYMVLGEKDVSHIKEVSVPEGTEILDIRYDRVHEFNSVEQWLYNIKSAKLCITNSYHMLLFSIIFHKPFIYIPWHLSPDDARADDMLAITGLARQKRKTFKDIKKEDFNTSIDWGSVDQKIKERVSASEQFLKESLMIKPSYKVPYVNEVTNKIRKRYEKAYAYRLKEREYRNKTSEIVKELKS